MEWLYFFLALAGLICFALATVNLKTRRGINLVALGLAFWILIYVISWFRIAAGV